jgi:hypothetical protein
MNRIRNLNMEYTLLPVGTKVKKISGKPFKSKKQINTVRDFVIHPFTKRPAYLFQEDDSFVECRQCVAAPITKGKGDKRIAVEIIVGIILGILACIFIWGLDPKSREELMQTIWMLG